ncbi:MAG: hypothetical protein CMP07_00305 [Xanthomonadales bacterium]|nr:hypothetical protein [Xanthomonadales bacterium]|tara:strand:- start:825 stop:1820 length:996 start_codon:yes stop_codon:yes gene_type:complete
MLRISCVGLALSIMAGCAATSFNDVMEESYADFQGGGDISSVMIAPTSRGDQVFSGIRSWGDDPVVLGESDTFDLLDRETEWGRLRIIGPARNRSLLEAGLAEIPPETIDRGFDVASQVIGARLQAMDKLQQRRIALSFFVSGDSKAYNHVRLSPVDGDEIEMVVRASAEGEFRSGRWWLANTSVAAHELTHLNHSLLGNPIPRDNHAVETNAETAAMMVSYCAQYHFVEAAAESDERALVAEKFEFSFEQERRDAFPGLSEGEFNPVRARVREFSPSPHGQANLLSTGLAWMFFNRIENAPDYRVERDAMYAVCGRASNEVPDYLNGDWK